jgi:hypothetical protein
VNHIGRSFLSAKAGMANSDSAAAAPWLQMVTVIVSGQSIFRRLSSIVLSSAEDIRSLAVAGARETKIATMKKVTILNI